MSSAPGGSRTIKKGEVIFKEGDKVQNLFLVQSGQVAVQIVRGKPIDLFGIGPNQVLGDYILTGVSTHPFNAVATAEAKVLELPLEAVKAQIEASPQVVKVLTKSSLDRLKGLQNELKSVRLERDSQACPPDQLAKIFATVYHVSRYKGEVKKDGTLEVSWQLMKQYAQRLFLESPRRLEAAVKIFVKLNLAHLTMQKNAEDPEAPEEIAAVTFKNIEIVEWVAEHWQYYYFKGGKTELLKTDEKVMQIVAALVAYGNELEADRNGAVRIEFSQIVERLKNESGITLNADFFGVIETKGLFVKRVATDKGVLIQFEHKEFARWSQIWTVLKEIEKWNEKGSVDLDEPAFDPRKFQKTAAGNQCPSCGHGYEGAPKFCGECGQKLTVAA
jgi:CRP-like cAMP-binding protein